MSPGRIGGEGGVDLSARESPDGWGRLLLGRELVVTEGVANGFAFVSATIWGESKLPPSTASGITRHTSEGVDAEIHWASVGDALMEECMGEEIGGIEV